MCVNINLFSRFVCLPDYRWTFSCSFCSSSFVERGDQRRAATILNQSAKNRSQQSAASDHKPCRLRNSSVRLIPPPECKMRNAECRMHNANRWPATRARKELKLGHTRYFIIQLNHHRARRRRPALESAAKRVT